MLTIFGIVILFYSYMKFENNRFPTLSTYNSYNNFLNTDV